MPQILGGKIVELNIALWPPTSGCHIEEQEFLLKIKFSKGIIEFEKIFEINRNQWTFNVTDYSEIFEEGESISEVNLRQIISANKDSRDYYLVANMVSINNCLNLLITEILLFSIDEIENPYGIRLLFENDSRLDFFSNVDGGFVSMPGIHENISIYEVHKGVGELKINSFR